jgi:hypothetical protein
MPVLSQFSSQTLFSAIQIINFDTYHNQLLIIPYYFDCYSLVDDATSLLSFSRHWASCSTCFWSQKKAHTMATTAAVACPNDKCGFRQCKILGHETKPCAGPNCNKLVHLTCYNGLQMMFTGVPKLGGDLVACSKKCAIAATTKEKNGGDSRQSWDHDAKTADGPTSTSILMDWWTTHGNYATYRGKDNEGKTKKAFAVELAKKMAQETTSQHCTAAQVQSKILTQQQLNGVLLTNGPKPLVLG